MHTYTLLEVSNETYIEIATKLKNAGYDHAFTDHTIGSCGEIDMHGLAIFTKQNVVIDPNDAYDHAMDIVG